MKLHRRGFLHLGAGITALSTASRLAGAQTYPMRPITMVVPNSPGTGTDAWTRIVAERMRGSLKQPIIVENIRTSSERTGTSVQAGLRAQSPMATRS
jgi:tripartite-type tricarboxylate transporter receptor subunit TctC